MYFFTLVVVLDIFLLTAMAYDRLVAICHPLLYTAIMNPRLCALLVLVSWIISLLHALLESLMVLQLSFCTVLEIPHFFCELHQMIQLSNFDTLLNNMVMYFVAVFLAGGSLFDIIYLYSKTVFCIHEISSSQGKYKAFSTCASHLSFYLPLISLILLHRFRSVPQLCCYPQLTLKRNSLSDVHCGHTYAEPLHLQSEK